MKHTLGKWTATLHECGAFDIHDEDGATIASRNPWTHRVQESEANAHLIAAAPELLAACEAIDGADWFTLHQDEMGEDDEQIAERWRYAVSKARDAIASSAGNE